MDIELTELNLNGEPRDVILTAPKNGFFYVIDRKTGKLISAQNYVKVTWASRIDTATGRPVENPEARYPAGREAVVYPGAQGAHSIEAMSFNPKTGLAYLNAIDMGNPYVDPEGDLSKWHFIDDAAVNMGVGAPKTRIGPSDGHNSLLAWDPVKQRAAWSVPLPGIKNGATLTTAGNLVFQGTVRGQFIAYAADTGKKLWAFDAQNGVEPQGISYEVNGKQYISVISDWRWAHAAGPGTSWDHATQKRRLLTFALGGRAKLPPNDSRPLPFVDDPAVKIDPALAGLGAGIYARKCMMCHGLGLDSAGGAPDLRKSAVPLSNEAFDAVLAQGPLVANGMPRFADLTLEERRALQAYIRSGARAAMHEGSTNPAEKPAGGTLQ
jgi:quinohemoprotein ethanol dehydrogenase